VKNKLIVALDVNSFKKAKRLINALSQYVDIFKVGSELFTSCGPKIIDYLRKKKKKTFLDLKYFDIPNTVEKAALAAAKHKAFMLTLHTLGGFEMLKRTVKALKKKKVRPVIIGITVLTSKNRRNTKKKVVRFARLAKKAGLDGIVCSAQETRDVKKICGKNFTIINPGIRPLWAARNDQKRVATPKEAVKNGADFVVIGRPIIKAKSPAMAAQIIVEEMK